MDDLNWKVTGTGDFNFDGMTDITWQHMGHGMMSVWHMNDGANRIGANILNPQFPSPPEWRVQAVGDISAVTVDADNDLMPDTWEIQHFGNLSQNGSVDFDNDGLTNLQEYRIATNPAQAYSNGSGKTDGQWDMDGDYISNAGELNWSQSDPTRRFSLSNSFGDGQAKAGLHNNLNNGGILMQIGSGAGGLTLTFTGTVAGQSYHVFTAQAVTGPWKLDRVLTAQSSQTSTTYPASGPALFFVGGTTQDSDGDGLPDTYEALVTRTVFDASGGSADGTLDPDADGLTHLAEFIFKSNPIQSDNPLNFSGIANGATLDGGVILTTGVRAANLDELEDLGLYVLANGEPHKGFSFYTTPDGSVKANWQTTYVPNGTYTLQIQAQLTGVNVSGTALSVTVNNIIWFPDFDPDCGDAMRIAVKSQHVNGSWIMDIYDEQDFVVGELEGTIDSAGWLVWPGENQELDPEPGWSLGLIDPQTGEQLPSKSYLIEVATFPGIGLNGNNSPGATAPATAAAVKLVERKWKFPTKFAVAYMNVFNPSTSGEIALKALMDAIWEAANARNTPGVVNGQSQLPFVLASPQHWGELVYDLGRNEVRNFFYLGHGGANHIGGRTPNTRITVGDLNESILNNDQKPFKGPNLHPYRFVFLEGCKTASGDFPQAFGIPKEKNVEAKRFQAQGMRYRAFVGWNSNATVGFGQSTFALRPYEFLTKFFELWPEPNQPRTLRQAINNAGLLNDGITSWNELSHLIIYGYEGLLWQDTDP